MIDSLVGIWTTGCAITQSWLRFGHNIYKSDWDALIILDACRTDALREVADKFEFITRIESKWSRGSTSKEWLENTFVKKYKHEVNKTAYITANSYARFLCYEKLDRLDYLHAPETGITQSSFFEKLVKQDQLRSNDFLLFESLWDNVIGGDSSYNPEIVTDRTIKAGRELDPERLIAHYMQPHVPYVYPDELDDMHKNPFEYLPQRRSEVWDAYIKNLIYVLYEVEKLLNNLDAEKVIITSDHGELFGRYLRTHPIGVPHPKLRKVPWVTTTASDSGAREPAEYEFTESLSEKQIENKLKDLGYM